MGRGHDRLGPPLTGVHMPMLVDHRFEGAHHGGADGNDAAAVAASVVDAMRGRRGHPEVLGIGRLVRLERGHPGVQEQRGHTDSFGDQARQHLGGEGSSGARHLGRARFSGVDVLIGRDRERPLDVAVSDRSPVPGQVGGECPGRLDDGDPESDADTGGAGRIGGQETHLSAAAQGDGGPRGGLQEGASIPADLDGPQPGRQLRREVDLHGPTVGSAAVDLGRQGARGIEDHQVALVEEAGELGEVRVQQ